MFSPPTDRCQAMAFYRSIPPSISRPSPCQARATLVVGYASLHLRLTTTAVFRSIDCALRLHSALRRHPSCVGGWLAPFLLRSQTIFDGYTSLRCQPVIAFGALLRKETSVCFSGSSRPLRSIPFSISRATIL